MIFYGYVSIILVVALLILLSEFLLSKFLSREIRRRILHVGTFAVYPLALTFFGGGSYHFIIVCAVFSLFTIASYFLNFFKSIDARKKKYPGMFYYALALLTTSVLAAVLQGTHLSFGIGFIALAFGDGLATLVGQSVRSRVIHGEKTLAGFLACFAATAVGIGVFSLLADGFIPIVPIILLALLAAIVELVDFGLDNLALPIVLFGMSLLLLCDADAQIALAIAEGIFCLAFFSGLIDYYGSLLSAAIGFGFCYFGGIWALLFVLGCYAVMISVSVVSKMLKNDLSSVVKKTKGKDVTEIFVNGAFASLSLILLAALDIPEFLPIALTCLAGGFVDSLASDVGTLSHRRPYDVFRRRYVTKGMSGGVTLLGCLASFVGAAVFSIAIALVSGLNALQALIPLFATSFGCFVDTLLGSLVQVKYICAVCGRDTEREEHCGTATELTGGVRAFNNDTVNFISGAAVFLTSLLLLI
jgi:uncharacterized membrane protein